jgi:glutamate/tyrosine decarboxylase-like PLP-dependent enzyme
LAAICRRENLWFHVDGAFGAMAMLSEEFRPLVKGIDQADSLAFDFHKWLHVPYDAGCILVRDGCAHQDTFKTEANYLSDGRGAAAGAPWFCNLGPELSRCFRALKVWFTIKEHGLRRLGEEIAENCRQARFLAKLVDTHPLLELLAPVSLNIVCFRCVMPRFSSADLNRLNAELVIALAESGIAVPSTTQINGRLAIRVNITNHRTQTSDLQRLIDAIEELAPSVGASFPVERDGN